MTATQSTENISTHVLTSISSLENATWDWISTTDETFNLTKPWDQPTQYQVILPAKYWIPYYVSSISNYVIFALTSFGSVSTIITMTKMKALYTTTIYMITLAATDLSSSLIKGMRQTRKLLNLSYGNYGCRVDQFFSMTMPEYSNWIIVFVTVERYIAICHPLKVTTICTKRNTAIVLITSFVFFMILNAHYLETMAEVISSTGKYQCTVPVPYRYFAQTILPYVEEFFYSIGPCIILFALNICIINGLKMSNRMKKELSQTVSENVKEKSRQNRQLTRMLLCLSIMFFLFSMPASIYFIAQKYISQESVDEKINYVIGYSFVYLFSDLNQCMNFFVYIITGRRFREEFLKWFCCREPTTHRRKILRSGVNTVKFSTMSDVKSVSTVYTNEAFSGDNETKEDLPSIASVAV